MPFDVEFEWRWSIGCAVALGRIIDIPVLIVVLPMCWLYIAPRGVFKRRSRNG